MDEKRAGVWWAVVERWCRSVLRRCTHSPPCREGCLHRNRGTHLLGFMIVLCYGSWLFIPCQKMGKQLTGLDCLPFPKFVFKKSLQGRTQPQMFCWRYCLITGTRILRLGPKTHQIHHLKICLRPKELTALISSGQTQALIPTKGPSECLREFIFPYSPHSSSLTGSLFSQVIEPIKGIASDHIGLVFLLYLLVGSTCESGILRLQWQFSPTMLDQATPKW